MNLISVAEEVQHRIIHIFGRDVEGRRATNGGNSRLDFDPHFRDYVWFYEVSILLIFTLAVAYYLTISFSMPITVAVSALRTRLAGKPQKPSSL
jgi:hypothetical protein